MRASLRIDGVAADELRPILAALSETREGVKATVSLEGPQLFTVDIPALPVHAANRVLDAAANLMPEWERELLRRP